MHSVDADFDPPLSHFFSLDSIKLGPPLFIFKILVKHIVGQTQ